MSQRLTTPDDSAIAIATAAATLPFPPVAGQLAAVPAWWTTVSGTIPELILEFWGAAALTFTAGELWGGTLFDVVIADTTIDSVDHTVDTFTEATHGWKTGDGPIRLAWATTFPPEITAGTDYWLIVTGASTFKIATSFANALAGTALAFSSNGTGALTLSDTADTERIRWGSEGLLDASIALDTNKSYRVRCDHAQNVVAYALVGTLSGSTITGAIFPAEERSPSA